MGDGDTLEIGREKAEKDADSMLVSRRFKWHWARPGHESLAVTQAFRRIWATIVKDDIITDWSKTSAARGIAAVSVRNRS